MAPVPDSLQEFVPLAPVLPPLPPAFCQSAAIDISIYNWRYMSSDKEYRESSSARDRRARISNRERNLLLITTCSALFLPVSSQAERERKDRMQADQTAVERPLQLFRQMSDALATALRWRV